LNIRTERSFSMRNRSAKIDNNAKGENTPKWGNVPKPNNIRLKRRKGISETSRNEREKTIDLIPP